MQRLILASAIALLGGHAVLAEEVNPFTGAHGKIEDLRLQSDTTAQRNKLVLEQIELRKNEATLKGLDDGAPAIPDKLGDLMGNVLGAMQQVANKTPVTPPITGAAQACPPKTETTAAPLVAPAKPARAEMKLSGVIDTAEGLTAILTQGDKSWTVSRGDRVGKSTVIRVEADKVTLSGGRLLRLASGEYTVANGDGRTTTVPRATAAGGSASFPPMPVGDEMRAIMSVSQPAGNAMPSGTPLPPGPPPAPATFK